MRSSRTFVLGITARGGAAACCLMRGGTVVAVAEEASFTRVPRDDSFPARAIQHVLGTAGIGVNDAELAVVACGGDQSPAVTEQLRTTFGFRGACEVIDRATAHAACAFLFSPFGEAAVMTIDAHGAANYFLGRGTEVTLLGGWPDPAGAVRVLDVLADELAVEGDRTFELLGVAEGGTDCWTARLAGLARHSSSSAIARTLRAVRAQAPNRDADLARSAEHIAELALESAAAHARRALGKAQLCVSFDAPLAALADRVPGRVFVAPARDAAAVAMGAAGLAHGRITRARPDAIERAISAGPAVRGAEVARLLGESRLVFTDFRTDEAQLMEAVTDRLAVGYVVAWHQGEIEVGGHVGEARMLLASPQRLDYVMRLRATGTASGARRRIVHVTDDPGVDSSDVPLASVVTPQRDGRLARLLRCFEERTGCKHLVAASLRAGDEPTACSAEDALRTFARAQIATLVIDDFLVDRAHLPLAWAHRIASERPPHAPMIAPSVAACIASEASPPSRRFASAPRIVAADGAPPPSAGSWGLV